MNLALHLLAILLLWDVMKRMLPTPAALIATAIFAVHPFQAEPVNYVFARSTLLSTVLCLAALASWLRGRTWMATAWFGLALLGKEECVAFPVFLLFLHCAQRRARAELKPIAVMLALSVAAGLRVLLAAQSVSGSGAGAQAAVSWQFYALTQGTVIFRYLRMFLVPAGFTVDPDIRVPEGWVGIAAWAGVLAAAAASSLWFTRLRPGFWFLAGLILLLPSSSVFPATDLAADRRMYLPMIGFAACAGLVLARARPVLLLAVLVLLIGASMLRTSVWRTEESLWRDAVAKAPAKVRPRIQLARAVAPESALSILNEAREIAPEDPRVPAEKGSVYLKLGRPELALPQFGRALALSPRSVNAMNNRGVALLALGQNDAARADFERVLDIDPCQFDARFNLLRMGISKAMPPGCRYTADQSAALGGN